ncbi:MAG TPA: GAF domain-containing sensor histidine kinase [Thermoanaerobaculia bacterium]|nr:GAF domain-containing sensor histidine kinase [Thermoanaerobaculia bacterium]
MSEPVRERRSVWRVGPESTWTTVLPVVFVIASLVALAALPVVVGRHTAQMRQEITSIAEPARRAANDIQIGLSSELDKVIAFQVTGETQYRDGYRSALDQQVRDYAALRRLGPQLGEDVNRDLQTLIAATQRWHAGVTSGEFLQRQLPAEVYMTRLFERHPSYEQALRAANDLENAIQSSSNDRLSRIRNAERLNMALTIFLTLLALTSALLVAGLGRQTRLLAREAMRRRQEAEREAGEAKVARAAAESEERRAAFLASAVQELASSLDVDRTVETLKKLFAPNLAASCSIDLGDAAAERPPEHLPSKMVIPMISRGQKLGTVALTATAGHVFTRDDRQLAEELARHGSLAIDNAILYTESQQAVRAREEVLAIVSHDLRNPLNSVMLAASLLQVSPTLSADDREQLETLDISAKRMKRLIEDLLDVTRLEGGKQLPIEPVPLEIRPLMDEAYELFKPQAATTSITLHRQVADGLPPVCADHHRVLQVLSNLIGNALKFTPRGGIIIVRAERSDAAMILFTVSDTGPGIPKENLKDIFNPYWQAKRTERLGAGLGLPIAKGIVESHRGRIWVESEPGRGTKFYFTLPAVTREAPINSPPAAESPAHR